jgi:hypothetical protein
MLMFSKNQPIKQKQWINTKVEFEWSKDLQKYVEISTDGYWYDGEMALCTYTHSEDVRVENSVLMVGRNDGAPSLTAHDDADTGIGWHSDHANNLFIVTAGNEAVRIDPNGRVGIGTGSPAANGLHIASSTSDAQCLVLQQTTNSDGQSANIAFYDYGDTNVAMIRGANISQASHHGALKFYTNAGSGNAQRAIIDKDGNVGIGTGSPGYNLEIKGQFYAGGSSIDYKKHVTDLDVDSSLIHSLRPVSYNYKKEYKDFGYNVKDGKQIGLVSEEVAKTIPELAIMKDGKPKNVDYQKLAVVLLAEVQSLKKDIEELKKDN